MHVIHSYPKIVIHSVNLCLRRRYKFKNYFNVFLYDGKRMQQSFSAYPYFKCAEYIYLFFFFFYNFMTISTHTDIVANIQTQKPITTISATMTPEIALQ